MIVYVIVGVVVALSKALWTASGRRSDRLSQTALQNYRMILYEICCSLYKVKILNIFKFCFCIRIISLTPWFRIVFENLIVDNLVNNFPSVY